MTKRERRARERALRWHAQKRARQRFGVRQPAELCRRIAGLIELRLAVCLGHMSRRVSNYAVCVDGEVYAVGYDRFRHLVTTFFPRHSAIYRQAAVIFGRQVLEDE
ncbi:MAG: hypothetical protein N2383_03300 [Caldilineales bacterium]|nr:hypothetical protein [Caldilineales bacterium]